LEQYPDSENDVENDNESYDCYNSDFTDETIDIVIQFVGDNDIVFIESS
jgi:hypothetical protein